MSTLKGTILSRSFGLSQSGWDGVGDLAEQISPDRATDRGEQEAFDGGMA